MFLKEVVMKNFKSFGKKTILVKLSKGLTVISGPNGSGKSNISDAILFVIGGQRTKKLRAENYAGLIFDGGKKGKGAKSAEVRLLFDNKDRKINVDSDTVEFTKKIKLISLKDKNVKTYYYINGRASSHGDFQNIFVVARLSSGGYNVVQQGTVNDIAESTPKQRRIILDDIAGITSLDEALERSNKRKEKVKIHLNELDFVIAEIDRHLRQLRKERNGALRYKKYQDELLRLKATLAHAKKQSLEAAIKEITDRIEEYKLTIKTSREDISVRNNRNRELALEIADLTKKMDEMEDEESRRLVREIREFQLELGKAKDRKITANEKIRELEEMREQRAEDLEKGEKEFLRLEKEQDRLSKKLERDNGRFARVDGEHNELSESMKDSNKLYFDLQNKRAGQKKALEKLKTERHTLVLEKEVLEERIGRHMNNLGSVEESVGNLQLEVSEVEWKLKEREKKRAEADKKRMKLLGRYQKLKVEMVELKRIEKELGVTVSRISQEYQKLRVQRRMAEEAGYGIAVKKVLDARDKNKLAGIHGTIAQLAQVDDEYETALSTAAGGGMQAVITKDDASGAKAIEFLKKNNYGRAAFLPLNKMTGGRAGGKALMVADKPGVIGFAIDLVDYNAKYRNAFWYIFQDTLVVKDMETAREYMGGVRLVTLDGQLIERSGAMVGGSRLKRLIKFGKKDDTRYHELRKELDDRSQRQQEIAERLRDVVEEFSSVGDNISRIAMEISQIEGEMSALEVNLKEFNSRLTSVKGNKKGASDTIINAKQELMALTERLGKKDEQIGNKQKEMGKTEKQAVKVVPEKLKKRMGELKEKRAVLLEKIMGAESKLGELNTRMELYRTSLGQLEEAQRSANENIEKQREIIVRAEKDVGGFKEEVEKRKSVEEKLSEKIRGIKKSHDDRKEEKWENERSMERLISEIESKGEYIISQDAAIASRNHELGEVMLKIARYDMEIEQPYPSQEELKVNIERLKVKKERLEPVNMVALEVYDQENERKNGITEKYDKLQEEMKSLENMVEDVKKKKREKFMEVYENVDSNFREMYPKICTNGEGYLHLENREEPFEGGLIIRARPPGKKMRDIRFLSGGEKSQVAIAFVLALQRFDPSPFYVLDEVDQNLDRVNSGVIASMIKQYSKTAQFIMISLHRDIMNYAHHLYGCYIKDGISQMVAIQDIQNIPAPIKAKMKGEEDEVVEEQGGDEVKEDKGGDEVKEDQGEDEVKKDQGEDEVKEDQGEDEVKEEQGGDKEKEDKGGDEVEEDQGKDGVEKGEKDGPGDKEEGEGDEGTSTALVKQETDTALTGK